MQWKKTEVMILILPQGHWFMRKVSYGVLSSEEEAGESANCNSGGLGVGRVTKPGLDQPVGNAAINHVPREMIEKEVLRYVLWWITRGILWWRFSFLREKCLAEHTFNPRLGIVSGISKLGTSGIVEPMSNQAILDTIKVESNQRKAQGFSYVAVSPGNYGLDFTKRRPMDMIWKKA